MKSKKSKIIIALCALILIGFLVENDNIVSYKSKCENSITVDDWTVNTASYRLDNTKNDIPSQTIPVVVIYNSKIVGDTTFQDPYIIDISNWNRSSSLQVPFYKKKEYDLSIKCTDSYEIKTDKFGIQYKINGKIKFSGKQRVIGLCSSRKADNIMIDNVMNNVYEHIKEKLNAKL